MRTTTEEDGTDFSLWSCSSDRSHAVGMPEMEKIQEVTADGGIKYYFMVI